MIISIDKNLLDKNSHLPVINTLNKLDTGGT